MELQDRVDMVVVNRNCIGGTNRRCDEGMLLEMVWILAPQKIKLSSHTLYMDLGYLGGCMKTTVTAILEKRYVVV